MVLFDGAWARINRAHALQKEMLGMWNSYLDEEPFQSHISVDDKGNGWMWVETVQPIDPTAGAIFGEWLYNLRSALDYAIYDLSVYETGSHGTPPNAKKIMFPIFEKHKDFTGQLHRLADLSPRSLERIEVMQPYNFKAGFTGDPTWWLHEMARLDRHRELSVVSASVDMASTHPVIFAPRGVKVLYEAVEATEDLSDGATIAKFKLIPPKSGKEITGNPRGVIDMEIAGFPGDGILRSLDINSRLKLIALHAESIVSDLERWAGLRRNDSRVWTKVGDVSDDVYERNWDAIVRRRAQEIEVIRSQAA
jgi:hypothetical protein